MKKKKAETSTRIKKKNNQVVCRKKGNRRFKKKMKFSNSDLERAIETVNEGVSIRTAARRYGVPVSTLGYKKIN